MDILATIQNGRCKQMTIPEKERKEKSLMISQGLATAWQ